MFFESHILSNAEQAGGPNSLIDWEMSVNLISGVSQSTERWKEKSFAGMAKMNIS